MEIKKTYFSDTQPPISEGVWLKPAEDGFVAYLILGGKIRPLKFVDDKETKDIKDDVVVNYEPEGASEAVREEIVGSAKDDASDLTLHGLRAYIDHKIAMIKEASYGSKKSRKSKANDY